MMKKFVKGILYIVVLVFVFYYWKDKFETNWGCTSARTNGQLHRTTAFPSQADMPTTGYDANPDFWTMPSTSPSSSARQYQQDYDLQAGFVQTMCSSLEVMSDGVSRTVLLQRFAQCQVKMRQIRREAAANGVRIIESPYENMTAPSPR